MAKTPEAEVEYEEVGGITSLTSKTIIPACEGIVD